MALPGYMKWLPPEAVERLGRLEFLAHGTVDGFVSGRHRSARKGASAEFAEHRLYAPGDDLRNLDWKLAARRQRLYIKQYVDETNLRAAIVLDASGSMGYRGELSAGGLSKLEYGQFVAASLAYLLVAQQDAVGFYAYDTAIRSLLPARAQTAQIRHLLGLVDALRPGGETESAAVIHEIAERIPRRSVVFLIGDFFTPASELIKAIHHLRYRHHEVIALQVVAREELKFPFSRMTRFENLERDERLNVDAQAIRREYLDRLDRHQAELKRGCGEMNVTHELLVTSTPFSEALSDVLVRYKTAGGGR